MNQRETAWCLLLEFTQSESLRKHALAVEACMRAYARKAGADEELWGMVGLLHDFDYEKYPSADDHPYKGSEILKSLAEVEAPSVRKKMKDKAFARSVHREDIIEGAADLGLDLEKHIAFCIEAMKGIAGKLGLDGSAAGSA
jgi:putative nucleotidyltransferase with HDIG domain